MFRISHLRFGAGVCAVAATALLCACAGERDLPTGEPSFYRSLATKDAQVDAATAASMISGYRKNNGLTPVSIDPELMKLAEHQPYRPAHIHFIVSAPNYETLITQVFRKGDDIIDEDPVFTADQTMIGEFRKDNGQYRLDYDFQLKPGISTMPKAPIP